MKSTYRTFLAALVMCFSAGLASAQISFLLVEKQVDYTQTNEAGTSIASGTPYTFRFLADGNGNTSTSAYTPMSITGTPAGSGATSVVLNSGTHYIASENTWEFTSSFANKSGGSGLDDQYANGQYSLDINGNIGTIALGSGGSYVDLYPEVAPMVTGLTSGDFNGSNQLKIDLSLTNYTFNFNSALFTSYTSGGHIGAFLNGVNDPGLVTVDNPSGSVQAESFYFGSSTDSALTQLSFNPSTSNMVAGNTYTLEIEYNLLTDGAINRFLDGETSAGLFTFRTSLTVIAIPEPSTYAAILGAGALAGVMLYRRRRAA